MWYEGKYKNNNSRKMFTLTVKVMEDNNDFKNSWPDKLSGLKIEQNN